MANFTATPGNSSTAHSALGYLTHVLATRQGAGRSLVLRLFGRSILLAVVRD